MVNSFHMYAAEESIFSSMHAILVRICSFLSDWAFVRTLKHTSSIDFQSKTTESTCRRDCKCFIMIHNTGAKRNIGAILRTAAAFNCDGIIFVGPKKSMQTFGAHGTQRRVRVHFFKTLDEADDFVRQSENCSLVGVEILPDAISLSHQPMPFRGSTCFLLGSEGFGLSEQDKSFCDYFIYIPQSGNHTASLNVATACGILVYQFKMVWCQCPEADREGFKYVVRRHGLIG